MTTPDFRGLVRRRLSGAGGLDDDAVAELAAQLDDAYSAAIGRGAGEAEALHEIEAELASAYARWSELE